MDTAPHALIHHCVDTSLSFCLSILSNWKSICCMLKCKTVVNLEMELVTEFDLNIFYSDEMDWAWR